MISWRRNVRMHAWHDSWVDVVFSFTGRGLRKKHFYEFILSSKDKYYISWYFRLILRLHNISRFKFQILWVWVMTQLSTCRIICLEVSSLLGWGGRRGAFYNAISCILRPFWRNWLTLVHMWDCGLRSKCRQWHKIGKNFYTGAYLIMHENSFYSCISFVCITNDYSHAYYINW